MLLFFVEEKMEITYEKIITEEQIKELYSLADVVWHEYFPCIITKEQIDYMVEMFFKPETVMKNIEEGYEFYFVNMDKRIGFISVHPEEDRLFLSKLYLTLENRGKGYASKMLDFVKSLARDKGLSGVYLTVNKKNNHTINVYKHHNFQVIESAQFDIGKGYIMDDFVMECKV